MQSKPLFYIALLTLALTGAWGVLHISKQDNNLKDTETTLNTKQSIYQAQTDGPKSSKGASTGGTSSNSSNEGSTLSDFDSILQLINNGQALSAARAINDHYSNLSASELDSLKSALLSLAFRSNDNDTTRIKNVLLATSKAFDELTIWKYLGDVAVSDDDWNTAFSAYFRASELENNSTDLNLLLEKLIVSSGHLRSDLEGNGDLLSIKNLYQRLSDQHPNSQRFQYELAISNLKLGEVDKAKQLLSLLIYDPELGEVSKRALASINPQPKEPEPIEVATQEPRSNIRSNDIVVPLILAGSSFIVDSTIERKPARLLLDTGASITSLSSQLIERLRLEPTGQSIRLSTANGLTNSRIFRVKHLKLGSLILRDMLIAEINLSNNRSFQGLLGTDALNQLKPQYSYLIDNQEKALIFRKR